MTPFSDIWKMLAGVAFFLLAMNLMENALRLLAGRKFKLFLKTQTTNPIKAIGGGAAVTALLQSSSITNLLVLSMVGAGVVKMQNALALMLGSNLGTTFNSWILATAGFNFTIESIALPVAGITGIVMAFINNESKWRLWLQFLFSLAFLFIALEFIKTGMEDFVKQTNLSSFTRYPVIVFLLLGVLLTTVVQSGSATIALTLSALHSNAISLYMATAIVLGSEIGTTFKLFIAAANGTAIKKRVALGNFLFNAVTVMLLFIILLPVNYFITGVLQINNDLIALAFFQSFVNVCCVIVFFPFLKIFGNFLLKRFADKEEESFYISKVPVAESSMALEALENETRHFIDMVINYSHDSFNIEEGVYTGNITQKKNYSKPIAEKYDGIKQLHGEMHGYYLKLQNVTSDKVATERLNQLIAAIRNTMYAAKNIRDAQRDIQQISNSSNDIKYSFYKQSAERLQHFYRDVEIILNSANGVNHYSQLTALYQSVTGGYTQTLQSLYKENLTNRVSEIEISTLINFNRELYTSFKSIVFGLKDYLLTVQEAEHFDTLPGFIR